MRRLARSTITIFILSFFVIYVKFLKVEDQLVAFFVQNANAENVSASKTVADKAAKKVADTTGAGQVKGKDAISTEINQKKVEETITSEPKNDASPAASSPAEPSATKDSNDNVDSSVKENDGGKSKTDENFDAETSFETIDLEKVTLETAREIINLRALRDTAFFDQAVTNITENKLDAKIAELKMLVSELQKVQDSINKQLKRKSTIENDNVDNLLRVIESMNPKQAANMFAGLNLDTRVLIVKRMDQAKLSSIISLIDPKIATETFERALQKE